MTLQDVLHDAQSLSLEDRRKLIKLLIDTLVDTEISRSKQSKRSLMELAGLGAEIWQGVDAQKYVDQLRSEWDHRP